MNLDEAERLDAIVDSLRDHRSSFTEPASQDDLYRSRRRSILIGIMAATFPTETSKRVLLVLFIPSADREGNAIETQSKWVDNALATLGRIFGGATAYPKVRGIWRDDERQGALVVDEPVVIGDEYLAIRNMDEESS